MSEKSHKKKAIKGEMGAQQSDFAELEYHGNGVVILRPGECYTCFDIFSLWNSSSTNGGAVYPITGPGIFQGIMVKEEGYIRLHLEGSLISSQPVRIEIVKAGELLTFANIGANSNSTVSTETINRISQKIALYQVRITNVGIATAPITINSLRFSGILIS